jgi:hypothetical protein
MSASTVKKSPNASAEKKNIPWAPWIARDRLLASQQRDLGLSLKKTDEGPLERHGADRISGVFYL